MTWRFASLVSFLIWCLAARAQAEPVTTIQNNGDPANRIDIVVLGDGYTAGELGKYATDVQNMIDGWFAQEPFKEYRGYFNVLRIDVTSNQSGADHPELGTFVDTALDATYNCSGIQRLICVDFAKVNTVLQNTIPSPASRDLVFVVVNDNTYGGSGGSVAVASTNVNAIEILLHETGHTLGLLADEYGGLPPACNNSAEPPQANVTRETVRADIKWSVWIDPLTPVPTTGPTRGVPGLYEGAQYCDTGLYRPTWNSKMRSLDVPFEQINTEQLVKRIYNFVSPIDATTPAPSSLTLAKGAVQAFTVTVLSPATQALTIVWSVDGQALGSGADFALDTSPLTLGDHTVEVQVSDPTPMVRNDSGNVLTETVSWTVNAVASVIQFHVATQSVSEGNIASVVVTRANGLEIAVTADYQIVGGTATNGVDFTLANGTVSFAVGQTSTTVTVPTMNDTLFEGPETITLRLVNPSLGATIGAQSETMLTIIDATPPTVTLGLTGSPMAENGGRATVTATLSGPSSQPVTVTLAFSGTATFPADYARSGSVITIPAGNLSGSITLTAVQDLIDEPDETIVVAIESVTNASAAGGPVTATIIDDDATPTVTLKLTGSPMAENGGTATVTATLSARSGQDVTVILAFSGTATFPDDYTRSASAITIPAGSLSGSIILTAVQDLVDEPNETIVVAIQSVTHAIAAGAPVTATITDDDPTPPDLRVTVLGNPPALVARGGRFSVTDTTRNIANGPALAASTTRYYLSLATVRSADDVLLIGSHAVPALGALASAAGGASVVVPESTALATYFLLACADDLATVAESDETNNCTASSTRVTVQLSNLTVTAVTNPPALIAQGGRFTVTDTTRNTSGVSVPVSTTRYYLSLDTAPSADDVLLIGARAVPALAALASSTGTAMVTLPGDIPVGTYFLLACADDLGVVIESAEIDNCRASTTQVVVQQPNLVVSAVSNPPAVIGRGGQFTVTDTTRNMAGVPALASTTRYYLSLDAARSDDDVLLTGARAVPALAALASSTGGMMVTVPGGTAVATYFLLACADDLGVVSESAEADNCRVAPTQVAVQLSNYTVTTVSNPPALIGPGGRLTVTDTTRNTTGVPAAASTTRYYLSLDTARSGDDVLLTGARAVPALAALASSMGTATVTLPGDTPVGAYFLLACAEDLDAVLESDETDNCKASSTQVNVQLSNLTVTAVSNPPALIGPGGHFTVTDTTRNTAGVPAPASTTRYYLSLDAARSVDDLLLTGARAVPALAALAMSTGTATVTLPGDSPVGAYFLLACAEDLDAVLESDETDNCKASSTQVTVQLPNVSVTAVSNPPALIGPGGRFSVTDTTRNTAGVSAPASTTRYYLSLDTVRSDDDVLLTGARAVPALGALASSAGTATVTLPANTVAAAYFLLACADDLGVVTESDEPDNCKASGTQVTVQAPPG